MVSASHVAVFQGVARATSANPLGYRVGEQHAVLIFVRQEAEAAIDRARAAAELEKRGWSNVSIADAGLVSVSALDSIHPHARSSYDDALHDGFAVIAFSEPIT